MLKGGPKRGPFLDDIYVILGPYLVILGPLFRHLGPQNDPFCISYLTPFGPPFRGISHGVFRGSFRGSFRGCIGWYIPISAIVLKGGPKRSPFLDDIYVILGRYLVILGPLFRHFGTIFGDSRFPKTPQITISYLTLFGHPFWGYPGVVFGGPFDRVLPTY